MQISVESNIGAAVAMLKDLDKRQVPFATAYALTQTAKAAQKEVQREIARVFDRPTRFTSGAVWVKPATKSRLYAVVNIQDVVRGSDNRPVDWLDAEIRGGPRRMKGFERLLQAKGAMPKGWFAVPTKAIKLDAYGNVSAGTINQILSQLQARNEFNTDKNEKRTTAQRRNSKAYRGRKVLSRFFAVMPGQARSAHLTPGIWERVNAGRFVGPLQSAHGSIRPVFIYVARAPRYKQRLKFYKIVTDTVEAQVRLQFRRGMALAARTAR